MQPSVIYDLLCRCRRLLDVLPNANNSNIYRIKDKARLIEKIDEENKQIKGDETLITLKNFKEKIGESEWPSQR